MNITLIGSGNMGSAFARQLSQAGHSVRIAVRQPGAAAELAALPGVSVVTAGPQAVAGSDLIVLATGYGQAVDALRSLGDLDGKVVLDITNPLTADYMGLTLGFDTSAAEQIAQAVPGVRVVKGFNTVFAQLLAQGADLGDGRRVSVFLAADDAAAKAAVRTLAESMGFAVVDAGGLRNARYLEPLAGLNIYLGYGAGLGTHISPTWVQHA